MAIDWFDQLRLILCSALACVGITADLKSMAWAGWVFGIYFYYSISKSIRPRDTRGSHKMHLKQGILHQIGKLEST
ncbi:hypothetical protein BX661DRAFT_68810 [Kickxella alabastrina]|uniref:uncharacterized protein n=1 Tax=Kickxella alabastrina TaxID=61397 RepID=UPI002220E61C|nr:uncharacterized protein BX661DRAFT_68810 [Kickxella alabastrina]KAI7821127.1 hypothetical protein BX661DRAFT_68810 [Kickxella alabastrina]